MGELIKLYTQIAVLRRGPQDLPTSALLMVLTIAAYVAVAALLINVLPPVSVDDAKGAAEALNGWPGLLLLDALFMYLWYAALLRLFGRPERTLQTVSAVFGFRIVLALPLFLSNWLWARFAHDPAWNVPIGIMGVVVLVWQITANARIVKSALEVSGATSVALVILQVFSQLLLAYALSPALEG
jgi:hypothetical protein